MSQTDRPRKPVSDEEARRKARLAAALRENLKRRKAQARARAADEVSPGGPGGDPGDGSL